jgi:hypothetical protein
MFLSASPQRFVVLAGDGAVSVGDDERATALPVIGGIPVVGA